MCVRWRNYLLLGDHGDVSIQLPIYYICSAVLFSAIFVMLEPVIAIFLGVPITLYIGRKVLRRLTYSSRIQLLGKFVDRVKTQEKVVALTYDDGPNPPYTDRLLDVLNRLEVKATFFVLGKQVELYPETAKAIVSEGHELGNHSYSHPQMIRKTPAFLKSEIQKTDRLLRELGVTGNIHFRPPFGLKFLMLPYTLMRLGKVSVLWNLDSEDYQISDPTVVVDNLLARVSPGSIILLHDALDDLKGDRSVAIAATELLVEKLRSQGYAFKTVSELLALK